MDINTLKSQAYDLIVYIQSAQNQLTQVNQAIAQAQVKHTETPTPVEFATDSAQGETI